MSYELPEDLQQRVRARLENGKYESENHVLRDALDALEQLEQEKLRRWHEGNRIAIEQSRAGLSRPLDDEAVLARLEQRLNEHNSNE